MDLSAFFLKCANKKPCNLRYYRAFYYIVKKSFTCDMVLRTLLYGAKFYFSIIFIKGLFLSSFNSCAKSLRFIGVNFNFPSFKYFWG